MPDWLSSWFLVIRSLPAYPKKKSSAQSILLFRDQLGAIIPLTFKNLWLYIRAPAGASTLLACLTSIHFPFKSSPCKEREQIIKSRGKQINQSTSFNCWHRILLKEEDSPTLSDGAMRITTSTSRKPLLLKQSVFYPRVSMCACNKNNCCLSSSEMSKAKPALLISQYGFHILLAVWATAIAISFGDWFCLRLGLKRLSDGFWLFGKRGQRAGLPWKWR